MPKHAPATTRGPLLTDAGPLIALSWNRDANRARCYELVRELRRTMVTTWAAFAEAMYLAGDRGGWPAQQKLWSFVEDGQLAFADPGEPRRLADLMERYLDRSMDLADATLLAVAAEQGHRQVFTLDDDFHVYRLPNGERLEVLP